MQRLTAWSTYLGALGVAMIVAAFLLGLVTSIPPSALLLVAGLGVILVAFYFITRPRDTMRQTSNVRTAIEGGNVLIIGAAAIGIVIALNYIADNQFHQRLDLTANQQHTLSQQTIQELHSLQQPVQVYGFFTPRAISQRQAAESLLKDYQLKTDKLVVQMVDPDSNPTLAQKYDIASDGTLVFVAGSRTEKVYNFDENSFTNAILKVTQTQQPAIYFTTGHGEYSIDDLEGNGLTTIVDDLKQVNYKVESLNFSTISNTLPADTRAIVIAGPTKKFSADDAKRIQDYLNNGGRVLVLAETNTDLGLEDLLKAWGLTLDNNLVLDPGRNYAGNLPVPVFTTFPTSPVTQDLDKFGVFFPGARSIKADTNTDKQQTALFTTTGDACAKTDFTKLQQQTDLQCAEGDAKGPFVVGYAVEGNGSGANPDQRARLVVIGNASFTTNQTMQNPNSYGNRLLFSNILNWLAGQEQLIAIPPRQSNDRPLNALSSDQINIIFWTSVALIPLAALTIGGLLWWRRR